MARQMSYHECIKEYEDCRSMRDHINKLLNDKREVTDTSSQGCLRADLKLYEARMEELRRYTAVAHGRGLDNE